MMNAFALAYTVWAVLFLGGLKCKTACFLLGDLFDQGHQILYLSVRMIIVPFSLVDVMLCSRDIRDRSLKLSLIISKSWFRVNIDKFFVSWPKFTNYFFVQHWMSCSWSPGFPIFDISTSFWDICNQNLKLSETGTFFLKFFFGVPKFWDLTSKATSVSDYLAEFYGNSWGSSRDSSLRLRQQKLPLIFLGGKT